jgi:hypothetical protein
MEFISLKIQTLAELGLKLQSSSQEAPGASSKSSKTTNGSAHTTIAPKTDRGSASTRRQTASASAGNTARDNVKRDNMFQKYVKLPFYTSKFDFFPLILL